MIRRAYRRFGAVLALAAVLLNALWPLASLANPRLQQAMVELCSAEGTRLVPVHGPAQDSQQHDPALEHCPLCPPAGGSAFIPSTVVGLPPSVGGSDWTFVADERPVFALSYERPRSRAPPVVLL